MKSADLHHQQPPSTTTAPPPPPAPPSQHFCLRWNNYQTNLTSVFDQLLQNESFVDVTLVCESHSIKAHKMVLSACSPYFQSLFHDNPCPHPTIIFSDVKWPELKSAVEFMYRGEINVAHEQISPLLKVAEILKIRGLTDVKGSDKDLYVESTADLLDGKKTTDDTQNVSVCAENDKIADATSQDVTLNVNNSNSNNNNNNSVVDEISQKGRKRRRHSDDQESNSAQCSPANYNMETEPEVEPQSQSQSQAIIGSTAVETVLTNAVPDEIEQTSEKDAVVNGDQMNGTTATAAVVLSDDMEIKPGIAEMIREEERSMWQKCWNTNQSIAHNLRFRERGPLKSWRPETMAEAIFSVLKEGLSLSQAARKYDIPYPTFVLYANRVHNMLGPSADGGTDLRPKGRGRPQRILLGIWPDEHIRGVIRAVVFRDSQNLKDDPHAAYSRLQEAFPATSCGNPESIPATVVAAVAQGLRQQMCSMVAAAQQQASAAAAQDTSNTVANLVNSLAMAAGDPTTNLPSSLTIIPTSQQSHVNSSYAIRSPSNSVQNNRISSPIGSNDEGHSPTMDLVRSHMLEPTLELGIGVSNLPYKQTNRIFPSPRHENLFQEDLDEIVKSSAIKDQKGISIKIEPLDCRND